MTEEKKTVFDIQLFAEGGDGNEPGNEPTGGDTEPTTNTSTTSQGDNTATLIGGNTQEPAGDGNGEQGAGQEPTVPETYDFTPTWGESTEVDQGMLGQVSAAFKTLGLSNEQANQLMGMAMQYGNSVAQKSNEALITHFEGLAKEAETELGSDFKNTVATAAVGVELMSQEMPGIRDWLDESGMGNDVRMIKLFAKMGKMAQEDGGHMGKGINRGNQDTLRDRWKNSPEMFENE